MATMKSIVIDPLIVQMLCDTVCVDKCFDQVKEIIERKGHVLLGVEPTKSSVKSVESVTKNVGELKISDKCTKRVAMAAEGGGPGPAITDDAIFREYLKFANVYTKTFEEK